MTALPSRPYSKIRGTEPSVTTILNELSKPGLHFGSAKEAALFAVFHQDQWRHLAEEEAVRRVQTHFQGIWNSAAAWGTLTHSVVESFANDEDVDLEKLILHIIDNDRNARLWREEPFEDLVQKCLGYVVGVEEWWERFRPRTRRAEVVVRTPGLYIGTTDQRCVINAVWPSDGFSGPQDVLLDCKTTSRKEEDKGYYVDSWTLQLHAYAFAKEVVHYEATEDENGKVHVQEVGTSPWTPPERLAILHLRGSTTFSMYELPISIETFNRFTDLCAIHQWRKSLPKVPQRIEVAEEGVRG